MQAGLKAAADGADVTSWVVLGDQIAPRSERAAVRLELPPLMARRLDGLDRAAIRLVLEVAAPLAKRLLARSEAFRALVRYCLDARRQRALEQTAVK